MQAIHGTLSGKGTITRADGTVEEFTISSDLTKEQAEKLLKEASIAEEEKQENKE